MSEHLNKIYDLIREKIKEIFQELDPRASGKNFSVTCPECKKHDAFIGPALPIIKCNHRTNCGYQSSFWDYLQAREGWTQGETLRGLAGLVGYNLPALSTEQAARIERANEDARTRERAFMLFRSWFEFEPAAAPAREYLKARGWSDGELEIIDDIGFFSVTLLERDIAAARIEPGPVLDYIKEIISGKPGEPVRKWNPAHSLVIPWRGPGGRIETFQFRAENDATDPKYLFARGTEKGKILFNFQAARAARKDEIYIVEGVIDALRLTTGGLPNAVALGGCALNEDHIRLLKAAGIKHATMILDLDKAGEDGTEKGIKLLSAAGVNTSFLRLPTGVKDPDEFLRSGRTVEELKALPIISGLSWLAERIYQVDDENVIERRRAFDRVIELAQTARFHLKDYEELFKTLAKHGTPPEALAEISEGIKARQRKEDADKRVKEALKTALKKTETGATPDEVFKIIEAARSEAGNTARPIKTLSEFLREKNETEKQRDKNQMLGYPLTKFTFIANQTDGIQTGLYLIGAGTSVGKTALLTNIAIDLIETNQELTVFSYSLDDTKGKFINRFLATLSGVSINDLQKRKGAKKELNDLIEAAYEKIISWNKAGRFDVKDIKDVKHIGDIENDVKQAQAAGKKLVIFIDALFNLDVDDAAAGSIREKNIERANQIKAMVDIYEIPVFCTVETRKSKGHEEEPPTRADIMETGKFAYNADFIYMLHSDLNDKTYPITVEIRCDKNKLAANKENQKMYFHSTTSTFHEIEGR